MKFDNAKTLKKYYSTINEIEKDHKRNNFVSFKPQIEKIKQEAFDVYDVNKIYLYGSILDTSIFNVDNISLFLEMKKEMFEQMVDDHFVDKYNGIEFGVKIENSTYFYKNKKWVEEEKELNFKLLL